MELHRRGIEDGMGVAWRCSGIGVVRERGCCDDIATYGTIGGHTPGRCETQLELVLNPNLGKEWDGVELGPFEVLEVREVGCGGGDGDGEVGDDFLFEGKEDIGDGLEVVFLPGGGDGQGEVVDGGLPGGGIMVFVSLGVVDEDGGGATEEATGEARVDGGMEGEGGFRARQSEFLEMEVDSGGVDDGEVSGEVLAFGELGKMLLDFGDLLTVTGGSDAVGHIDLAKDGVDIGYQF